MVFDLEESVDRVLKNTFHIIKEGEREVCFYLCDITDSFLTF